LPSQASNLNILILPFQIAKIAGMNHWCPAG
jgi:hypothetical protein